MPPLRYTLYLALAFALLSACDAPAADDAAAGAGLPGEGLPVEPAAEAALQISLPTRNTALLSRRPDEFYMGVNKDTIAGLREAGWEGGQYGFVRDPVPTPAGRVFRRLHEGLDIAPLYRDAAGEPLDTVRAIADGRVTFASDDAGASGYGRYVVVEHTWSGSPVYSLYAHLDSVAVDAGAAVRRGDALGRLGYTGRGLGRDRAHVHLEVAMLLNARPEPWLAAHWAASGVQGPFHGANLAGVDPEALLVAARRDPMLTFQDFVRGQPAGFQVAIPGDRPLDLLSRYPWLLADGADARPDVRRAWLVTLTRGGAPVRVERLSRAVAAPEVAGVARSVWERYLSTNRALQRTDRGYELTDRGRQLAALLVTTPDGVPPW